ncbi:MAG: YccF domain-containing protein [Clostridia bacterium]|nr:YccF domain-containing protein [Clostridia bacterium]
MFSLAGNLVWLLCGGLISSLCWFIAGLLWCVTVVGIPIGVQCFKFAQLSLMPFGKDVVYEGGAVSFLVNVVWFFISGIELALVHFILGVLLSVTIIGIPFGKQFFKFAKLSLAPFGAHVV